MDLGSLFQQVAGLVNNQTRQNDNVDTDGILGQIGGLFRQNGYQGADYQSQQTGGYNGQPVQTNPQYSDQGFNQSEADRQAGILPASADPLGDPADQR